MNDKVSWAAVVAAVQLPVQIALALLANAALIRVCSTHELRQWYLLMAVLPIGSVLEFGFPALAPRLFALEANPSRVVRYVRNCGGTILASHVVGLVPLAILTHRPLLATTFAIGISMRSLGSLLVAVAYARGSLLAERAYRFVSATAFNATIIALVSRGDSISAPVLARAWALTGAIVLLIGGIICLRAMGSIPASVSGSGGDETSFARQLRNGGKLTLASVPALFIFNLSIYYLSAWAAPADVVMYGLFLQVINSVNIITSIAPTLAGPRLARVVAANSDHASVICDTVRLNRIAAICVLILLAGFVQPMLHIVARNKLAPVDLARIEISAAAFICVECVQMTMTSLGIAVGIYDFHRQAIASAGLVAGLAYVLVPRFGYTGLIAASLIAQSSTCLPFNLMILIRRLKVPLRFIVHESAMIASAAALTVPFVLAARDASFGAWRNVAAVGSAVIAIGFLMHHRDTVMRFKHSLNGGA